MQLAQGAVRGDDVRLHAGVGAQPVAYQLVDAAVNAVEGGLSQQPHLRSDEKRRTLTEGKPLEAAIPGV